MTTKVFGFDQIWVWFIAFQALQIFLSARGINSIKWIEIAGAVIIMLGLVYLTYLFLSTFGLQLKQVADLDGTWDFPFWMGITAMLGSFSALFINIGDYTRYFPRTSSIGSYVGSHVVGLLPPSLLMPFIGMLGAAAVGIWNPIDVIAQYIPGDFLMIFMLIFIALAQITTNLVANILPPALVAMEVFKISWAKACVIIGILAIFTFPWWIMQAEYFLKFITFTAAFLGPIFAVMIVDYYIVHRRNYDISRLYDRKGMFQSFRGWNPAAIIAVVIGTVFAAIDLELSFFIGILPAGLIYYGLMKGWMAKYEPYVKAGFDGNKSIRGNSPATAFDLEKP